jgi:CRISPR-associated protein Cas1
VKKHDNTLYVTTQGAYLASEGTNVLVRVEKETRLRVPLHNLGGIVCFGNVGFSPFLLGACGKAGVSVAFHGMNGKFLARIHGPQSGNILLRRAQHVKTTDLEATSAFCRNIISAKIANSRTVLQRGARDHGQRVVGELIEQSVDYLADVIRQLQASMPVDVARGKEGEAARSYFVSFDELIVQQKTDFFFRERSRRPPQDNMNALMSFLYALLTSDVASACESVGLDPQMGFLHADRSGRPSLALDLMEELRPMIADRLALSLVNRQQVDGKGFTKTETGGVEMNAATRKALLVAYQKRKDEEIFHPFLKEKITVGLLPFVQARLLARWLRGELDAYPPFFWK